MRYGQRVVILSSFYRSLSILAQQVEFQTPLWSLAEFRMIHAEHKRTCACVYLNINQTYVLLYALVQTEQKPKR